MGSTIGFYCSNLDTADLISYIESIGMFLVSPVYKEKISGETSQKPFCYVPLIPEVELSPYGKSTLLVSDATDPLIGFMRSYYRDGFIVLGNLNLSNDVPELHKITRPKYQKICKWIKSNWNKYGDFYIGNDAKLLFDSGTKLVNVFPESASFAAVKY